MSEARSPKGVPAAEIEITLDLAAGLLAAQHPDLAHLELAPCASGWDNVTFRLGPELALRLPRRELGAAMIIKEQRWLPILAPALPVETPIPVRIGRPEGGYPWPWSIVRFIAGRAASESPLQADQAALWGRFLRALHAVDVPDSPPQNPLRGALADRDESFRLSVANLESSRAVERRHLDPIVAAWDAGLRAAPARAPHWAHGDLHARNVISDGGALRGVIDWGDVMVGDPAVDYASAWALFDVAEHEQIWRAYGGLGEGCWHRARAWASYLAVVLIDAGRTDDPELDALGRMMQRRVAAK